MLASSAGFQRADHIFLDMAAGPSENIPAQDKFYSFDESDPWAFFVRLGDLLYDKSSWDKTFWDKMDSREIRLNNLLLKATFLAGKESVKAQLSPDGLIICNGLQEYMLDTPRSSDHALALLIEEALDKTRPSESELAEMDHQACISYIQTALRFVLNNETENTWVAEVVSNLVLALRNACVVGGPTVLLTLITSAVEEILPEDTTRRTQITIAFSSAIPLLLKVVGTFLKYRRGEGAWKDVALDAMVFLSHIAFLAYLLQQGKLDELTGVTIASPLSKTLNQFVANTIVIESVKPVTDDDAVVERDHPLESIAPSSTVAGVSTAVSESYAFHEDQERKFYEYACSRTVNALRNGGIATASNTLSDAFKRWAKNCWNGSHDRLRITVHWPTIQKWIDIGTDALPNTATWAQIKYLATASVVSEMPDDKFIRTLVSTLTSILATGAEMTVNHFKSKPPETPPTIEEASKPPSVGSETKPLIRSPAEDSVMVRIAEQPEASAHDKQTRTHPPAPANRLRRQNSIRRYNLGEGTYS